MLHRDIGSNLFEVVRRDAVESKNTMIIVKTESRNENALLFYRRKGFVEEKQKVDNLSNVDIDLITPRLNLQE